MDVPKADIDQLKERLANVERAQARIEDRLVDMDEALENRIRLALYQFSETRGKSNRDVVAWTISLVMAVLFILFSLASLAVGIWG